MKTFIVKSKNIKKKWLLIDEKGQVLGRLATQIAIILRGKHKPEYTPNIDIGDYCIILNCKDILVTGNKLNNKIYYHHSGYPGGIKEKNLKNMLIENPSKVIKLAVKGMLPKGPLGRVMLKKLKIFNDINHDHDAQKPIQFNLNLN